MSSSGITRYSLNSTGGMQLHDYAAGLISHLHCKADCLYTALL